MISSEQALSEGRRLGLIILDLNLPRHDGSEILQRLSETRELAHVPVVVRKPSNLEQFLSLGAVFKDLLEHKKARPAA